MSDFDEPLDPFDPTVNARLMGLARTMAMSLGATAELGEDALQQVLVRVAAGDTRPIQSTPYFKGSLVHQIRDLQRREGRQRRLATKIKSEAANPSPPGWLVFVATSTDPEVFAILEEREELTVMKEVRRRFAEEMRSLPVHYSQAFCARLRQWLVKEGGEEAVRQFEYSFAFELGEHTGTAALAAALGKPPGTVACHANRALGALSRCFADLKES